MTKVQTRAVGPLDAGWLWLESTSNLMHGSVVCVFEPPADAEPGYVARLVDEMRRHTVPTPPFDRRLHKGGLRPRWTIVDQLDLDYHLRHRQLPAPGGDRELRTLVSELQSMPLDHAYPLWTVDVIEGLEGGRFMVFGKMHHALADGVAALGIVGNWLSESPDDRGVPPIWAYRKPPRPSRNGGSPASRSRRSRGVVRATASAARHAVTGVSARPWSAPRSALNTPITPSRRVATSSYELARFRMLADRSGGTINDVVLAVCSGGLRRYLGAVAELPERPLITNIPVSVRSKDSDGEAGNAVSWAMLSLATDESDARGRFDAIRAATTEAKQRLGRMPGRAIDLYTLLVVAPILVEQLTRAGGRVRPLFNVAISNVPGPRTPRYFNGAPMEEIQALTVIYGGQALNIVTLSYADRLDFALTACAESLPHVDLLARACEESLAELEEAFAI